MHRGVSGLAVAIVIAAVGCTSTAPMPSAGTQTPIPTAPGASASVGAATPAATVLLPATPPPTPSPTPRPTPPPTMPPPDQISAELDAPDSLKVCAALLGAPAANFDRKGELSGYNIAFASELARRLDLKPVIQPASFRELISMVRAHDCDISVSSQNITRDRSAQVNLVPYTQSKLGFPVVVAAGNPANINTLADLCGHDVAAAAGSTFVDQVDGTGDFATSGLNAACASAAASPITLHTYPSELDAAQALIGGSVDAYLGNANFVDQYPKLIEASTALLPGARQGIGVALDHPNLTTAVEASLGAMIGDGTYLHILREYLPSQSVDNFSIVESGDASQ